MPWFASSSAKEPSLGGLSAIRKMSISRQPCAHLSANLEKPRVNASITF